MSDKDIKATLDQKRLCAFMVAVSMAKDSSLNAESIRGYLLSVDKDHTAFIEKNIQPD